MNSEFKNKTIVILLLFFLIFTFAGCAASGPRDSSGARDDGQDSGIDIQAGQLTASEWSDIKNYDFYKSLFVGSQESQEGIFTRYYQNGYFDTLNMIDVTVKNGDVLLSGAIVELTDNNQNIIYKAVTNANGIAYLFPKTEELLNIEFISIKHQNKSLNENYQYSLENTSLIYELDSTDNKKDIIEIMFVIDTTGSMGDEIRYLKAEIDYVISEVQDLHPDTTIKLALLFYRDLSDAYVTRYFDFTTNIEVQKQNLSKQSAAGGGDFPEAVDIALDEAVAKNWSTDNTTKLIFHVLDAPPHDKQEDMTRYFNAINTASAKGIRMIPVASSGIDKYTEYLLRNEAMMTGGTYVFLTDHSGIGNSHLEATVGEVDVEYLNNLLIRLIGEYHTGIPGEKIIVPGTESNNNQNDE